MTGIDILAVGLGGFIGALIRYFVSRKLNTSNLPFGTLSVNWVGALLIGFVFGLGLPSIWLYFLASGFAGALTTFSTMKKELIIQWKAEKRKKAAAYLFATYSGGIILTFIGYTFGTAL